ncbi:MAG: hypothetical protein A3H98_08900 [Bacteroidetes bacterium RIFCSPLOWO2_02_FULL_36_8]|nr:MAG: hypothetical protein A3H98_08900 [Bacteroidetes bacterium RIFCSPLOWO2_02_FULL_36_8]OFY70498.1 MAG: hypothetical protein A3G23_10270 [Bacteroidetes bacterium RIFCSPLOWO2_12_FULL_37_12]
MKTHKSKISVSGILKASNRRNVIAKGLIETGNDNWLMVRKESDNAIIAISKYCRVKDVSFTSNGREKFTILDWPNKNVVASVTALPDSRSRFSNVQYNVGAVLTFDYKTKKLTVNPGGIVVNAGFDSNNKLKNGEYLIFQADFPHEFGDSYMHLSSYSKTWFFIKDDDNLNRYLHIGSMSLGCLTIGVNGSDSDRRRWNDIAPLLLTQRIAQNDSYIGKLIVKGA